MNSILFLFLEYSKLRILFSFYEFEFMFILRIFVNTTPVQSHGIIKSGLIYFQFAVELIWF